MMFLAALGSLAAPFMQQRLRLAACQCVGRSRLSIDAGIAVVAGTQLPCPGLDDSLLPLLVCPMTKTPLRYDCQQQQLVNDELSIAYPIVDGVPHLMPTKGQLLAAKDNKAGQQAKGTAAP